MTYNLIYLLTALLIGAGVLVGFSWIFARWWCKPKRVAPQKTPANYELIYQAVRFSSQGVFLNGWFIPGKPGSEPWPAIVMMHGWSRSAAELLPYGSLLNEAGFAFLLFDARGHGQSGEDGPITIKKFTQDILAGLDYLATRTDVDGTRLGVFGRSLGGSSAILASAQDQRIRALVSCSAFAHPRVLMRDTLKMMHIPAWLFTWFIGAFIERWLGTSMENVAPVNVIHRIAAPILLVHGEADRYIKPQNLDILFSQASTDHSWRLLVPSRGHTDLLHDQHCRQAVIEFFKRHLQVNQNQTLEAA